MAGERLITPREYREQAETAFKAEVTNQAMITKMIYRGLDRDPGFEMYGDFLPRYGRKNVKEIIREKIDRAERPVRIVDVGYGAGYFLLGCRKEYGDAVELVGYGTDIYTKVPIPRNPGQPLEPSYDKLMDNNVRLVDGNIIDIRSILGDCAADVLVSVQTLSYVPYPKWELVKKLYRVVDQKGIGLLDMGPHSNPNYQMRTNIPLSRMQKYLQNNKFRFEIDADDNVSFQRTEQDITLPIYSIRDAVVESNA